MLKDLNHILTSLFNFKEWSSLKNQPTEFTNYLKEFGFFKIYDSFKDLLNDQDHFLMDFEGNDLDINEVFSSKDKFSEFLENQFNLSNFHNISFDQVNEEILYAQVNDTTEPKDFIEMKSNIKTQHDLFAFINDVLSDIEEVTHSSGIKNKYEVVGIDSGE